MLVRWFDAACVPHLRLRAYGHCADALHSIEERRGGMGVGVGSTQDNGSPV